MNENIQSQLERSKQLFKELKESCDKVIKAAIELHLKQGDPIPEPIDKKKFKGICAATCCTN